MNNHSGWWVLSELRSNGWVISDIIINNDKIDHIYFKDDKEHPFVVGCYTSPHKENDEMHMLRYELVEKFDRWANAAFETFYSDGLNAVVGLEEGLTKEVAYKVLLRIYGAESDD